MPAQNFPEGSGLLPAREGEEAVLALPTHAGSVRSPHWKLPKSESVGAAGGIPSPAAGQAELDGGAEIRHRKPRARPPSAPRTAPGSSAGESPQGKAAKALYSPPLLVVLLACQGYQPLFPCGLIAGCPSRSHLSPSHHLHDDNGKKITENPKPVTISTLNFFPHQDRA